MTAAVGAAVFLVAVFLLMALYGSAAVHLTQDRRYRMLELRSEVRARAIQTDRLIWAAEQRMAREEQAKRHAQRRMELHYWQREYSGY